nr:O-antigen translocase [uncultured Shinella sp.]
MSDPCDASASEQSTHTQILKSTLLVGASSVVGVVFSIIRNKAVALMLGPEGIGLMGLYSALADMAQNLAGMGVQSSGVRQIAETAGTNDDETIARTARVLSRTAFVLAALAALLLVLLAVPLSGLTFGDHQQAGGIALLSLAVALRIVSGGQMALLQGLRRIADLAIVNVAAAFAGTVITIPLIYFFGLNGIVPSLIAVAAVTGLASWYFRRQVQLPPIATPPPLLGRESRRLLKLGLVFMASGLLTFGAAYANRLIVLHAEGITSAGFYQAAWAIGGLYAGIVLQAMGTDFYPRLTAVSENNAECNRLVNEQVQMSLLLAGPGVVATLTFAPFVLHILYSHAFDGATDLLRWICLGMMLRIVAWPMGYIVIAKGAEAIFFWTEVAATVVHVGLAFLLVPYFGAAGAGMAFLGLYIWHGLLIYGIVRRMSGFRWSRENAWLTPVFILACAFVFLATQVLPLWQSTLTGSAVLLLTGLYSMRKLVRLVPHASLPSPLKMLIARFA